MNLPNKLTLMRIVLVPILVLLWLFPYSQFGIVLPYITVKTVTLPLKNLIVLVIFIIASITDYLDGQIARKKNLITTFGKFADPIADKLLVNTIFILLAADRVIPVVPVIIMLSRDTIVDCCRMLASSNGVVVAAGYMGKLKTVLQMFAIISILLCNVILEAISIDLSSFLLWSATFVSVASGYSYFIQLKEYIFESM